MWEFGMRPFSFISGNICNKLLVQCLCSVVKATIPNEREQSLRKLKEKGKDKGSARVSVQMQNRKVLLVIKG
jgi:hypothetical protein